MTRELKKASTFQKLTSFLFRKSLQLELKTDGNENGELVIEPSITLNGDKIDPKLLSLEEHQNILGHNVQLDHTLLDVLKKTQGKTTSIKPQKGVPFLKDLKEKGVKIKSRSSQIESQFDSANLSMDPQLNATRDRMELNTKICNSEGVDLSPPPTSQELKDNGRYIIRDGNCFRLLTSASELLKKYPLDTHRPMILQGQEVPDFIHQHQKDSSIHVKGNDHFRKATVFDTPTETFIKITGDKEQIQLCAGLNYGDQEKPTSINLKDFKGNSAEKQERYTQVPDGWVDTEDPSVESLKDQVGQIDPKLKQEPASYQGTDIPEILKKLKDMNQHSPWNVYISSKTQDAHQLIEEDAHAVFEINVYDDSESSGLSISPIYEHQRFSVPHDQALSAIQAGEGWVRNGKKWIKIDKKKVEQVQDAIDQQGLVPSEEGYQFSAANREHIFNIFSRLGSIEHGESYALFLQKLGEFEKIEPMSLPQSLNP